MLTSVVLTKYSSVTTTVVLFTTVIKKHECEIRTLHATHAIVMKYCVLQLD